MDLNLNFEHYSGGRYESESEIYSGGTPLSREQKVAVIKERTEAIRRLDSGTFKRLTSAKDVDAKVSYDSYSLFSEILPGLLFEIYARGIVRQDDFFERKVNANRDGLDLVVKPMHDYMGMLRDQDYAGDLGRIIAMIPYDKTLKASRKYELSMEAGSLLSSDKELLEMLVKVRNLSEGEYDHLLEDAKQPYKDSDDSKYGLYKDRLGLRFKDTEGAKKTLRSMIRTIEAKRALQSALLIKLKWGWDVDNKFVSIHACKASDDEKKVIHARAIFMSDVMCVVVDMSKGEGEFKQLSIMPYHPITGYYEMFHLEKFFLTGSNPICKGMMTSLMETLGGRKEKKVSGWVFKHFESIKPVDSRQAFVGLLPTALRDVPYKPHDIRLYDTRMTVGEAIPVVPGAAEPQLSPSKVVTDGKREAFVAVDAKHPAHESTFYSDPESFETVKKDLAKTVGGNKGLKVCYLRQNIVSLLPTIEIDAKLLEIVGQEAFQLFLKKRGTREVPNVLYYIVS